MTHFNLSDLESAINKRGFQAKTVVNHQHTTIKNLILEPGDVIPPHQVNVDVTFFILEGTGEITIGDDTHYDVKPNDVVLCPPNTPMSVKANSDGLVFLNIKTPGI